MKHYKRTIQLNVLFLWCCCGVLVGCKPKENSINATKFSATQNGFGVVVQSIGVDSGPGAKLYYKGSNETAVLVWPRIGTHGYPILYTNDMALLLADKPNNEGISGGALIAVQGTGPAMDISADLLKIGAEQAHVEFKRALRVCRPLRLIDAGDKLKLVFLADRLVEPEVPDLEIQVGWDQVFGIVRDVKETGKTNVVAKTDVLYLQKEYEGSQ